MATPILPRVQSAIAGANGWTTKEWYDFFRSLLTLAAEGSAQESQIQDILARLEALENESGLSAIIQGVGSVVTFGTLADGIVQITLQGDNATPGNTYYYGTGPDGAKGFFPVSDALVQGDGITLTVGSDGRTTVEHADTSSVTDIAASFTGGTVPDQIGLTFDQFGHVLTRTITGRTLDHNDTGALEGLGPEYIHLTQGEYDSLNSQTLTAIWRYDDSIVMADPGVGDVRSNAATAAASTEIAFSTTTDGGLDAGSVLVSLNDGDLITFQHAANRDNRARFRATGTAVDNGVWVQVPVEFIDGAGTVTKNAELIVRFGIGGGAVSTDHNDLSGLQGGSSTERYHLTAEEHGSLVAAAELVAMLGLQSENGEFLQAENEEILFRETY